MFLKIFSTFFTATNCGDYSDFVLYSL